MSYFSLELIAHGVPHVHYLPLSAHAHKYTERFIYTDRVDNSSVPLVYFESEELDSHRNLQVVDYSWSVPENDVEFSGGKDNWVKTESVSYSCAYKDIAATDVVITDVHGKERPLFFVHELPDDTVEASIFVSENGKIVDRESGYYINLDMGIIYTNYRNSYSPVTGAYKLHYVVSVDSSGESTTKLLNPRPAAKLATWEDVGSDGKLTSAYPVFSRESSGSGYTFYFNSTGPWYIRKISTSIIKPFLPTGRTSEDSWYLRFSAGECNALVNSRIRNYRLPEFDAQPFFPYKPYVFSSYRRLSWVNSRTLYANRDKISVNPNSSMHFQLFVYDEDENLTRVWSTDSSKDGSRYSDTDIFIEADKVLAWDNQNGFVSFSADLDSAWSYKASMYLEMNDIECTHQSLNPLHNSNALDYMWVYYIVPDVHDNDRALHLISVDRDGKIAYCSQSAGTNVPNLQMFEADGSVNSDTVIGMDYISSDSSVVTFTTEYCSGQANDVAYFVVAEALCLDRSLEGDVFVADVRRKPGIDPSEFDSAILANSRLLQSEYGFGDQGQQVPLSSVMVVRPPLSLLEDYGGELTQLQAEALMRTYTPAAVATIFKWDWPKAALSGEPLSTYNKLIADWQGIYTYKMYRRTNPVGDWSLIYSVDSVSQADIEYHDTDIDSEEIYYYCVRVEDNGVEYPRSNELSMKAR